MMWWPQAAETAAHKPKVEEVQVRDNRLAAPSPDTLAGATKATEISSKNKKKSNSEFEEPLPRECKPGLPNVRHNWVARHQSKMSING